LPADRFAGHLSCWFRKKSICRVALQLRRCGAPVGAPHYSVFTRLACRGEQRSPDHGRPAGRPYRQNHRSAGFFEIINPDSPEKRLFFSRMSAAALHRHQPDGGLGAGRRKRFANPVRIRYHE